MALPEQRVRIVAAEPIEVGGRRLLPSVLVNTLSHRWQDRGCFQSVRLRPISLVVEAEDGAQWYEIPNETANVLSQLAAAAAAIGAVGMLLIGIILLLKRR